jgi:cytosine/adenosine deaminase-related metal-dependent hydrolase
MIITAHIVLTMQSGAKPLLDGAVVINHGSIIAVGPANRLLKKFVGHRVRNIQSAVLMPGLINVHTHLELPPLLESIQAKEFPDWVINLIRAKRSLCDRDYQKAAMHNVASVIESGTSCVGEICTHGVSPGILKKAKIRARIFHEIIDMSQNGDLYPGVGGKKSVLLSRINDTLSRETAHIKMGISPHAPHTVSTPVLIAISKIARMKNLPLCMHVAESRDELKLLQGRKSGFEKLYRAAGWDRAWSPSAASPFEYLYGLGLLGSSFLAVHSVHVTDYDIKIIRKTGTHVAHCPRSNHETGVGKMPLQRLLRSGITIGLGTDSLASSPTLNLWDEMRYAFNCHKADGIHAKTIMELATRGGAKALGFADFIGSLAPGMKADMIAISLPARSSGDIHYDLLRETKSCMMNMVNGWVIYEKDRQV